jgi:hypothetical protein
MKINGIFLFQHFPGLAQTETKSPAMRLKERRQLELPENRKSASMFA